MKIVVSSSLKQEDDFANLYELLAFNTLAENGIQIVTPFNGMSQQLSIMGKRERYIREIRTCDLLIVIGKRGILNETDLLNEAATNIVYGESVSWEVALAKYSHVPILYFDPGTEIKKKEEE